MPVAPSNRSPLRRYGKVCVWIVGIPSVLLLLLYAVLLITPIRLPFGGNAVRALAQAAVPPSMDLQMGEMALALEAGVWPVVKFSPVLMTDTKSGARVTVEALEIGFSPVRSLLGQPGATITLVRPHVQIVQDLSGPRVTSFSLGDHAEGAVPVVRVQEGEDAFPPIGISAHGIDIAGTDQPLPMRSDSDWLVYNMESSQQGIAEIVNQAELGRFSRLVIRDGTVDMTDSVFGLMRSFSHLNVDIGPLPANGETHGSFSTSLGGRKLFGTLSRTVNDAGGSRLEADITNIDFAAFLPFIDDPTSMAAVRGAGALSIDVSFTPAGKLTTGRFKVDLTGLDLRIADAYYPIASSIMDIDWVPEKGQFLLRDSALQIGKSSGRISGVFAMGVDKRFGPTMGMKLTATDVFIHPDDMDAPAEPFDTIEFTGWSAPLYGALGVDQVLARKGGGTIEAAGRFDVLQAGMGVDLTVVGQGVSADDLKRLWPFTMARESRDWFVANVTAGEVTDARLAFKFPVGLIDPQSKEDKPLPKGAMQIAMVGKDVVVRPIATMEPVAIAGETRLKIDDNIVTISAGGGQVMTAAGPIDVKNPALIMDNSVATESVIEVSGDVTGAIPAMLTLVRQQQPGLLEHTDLPVNLNAVNGTVDVGMVTTVTLPKASTGRELAVGYVLNGRISDFSSSEPILGRKVGNGQLAFSASQDNYQLGGTADVDGMTAELEISGTPTTRPATKLAATVGASDIGKLGFDVSQFLTGKLRFVAQPMDNGTVQVAVDLGDAGLSFKDVGISKAIGVPGTLHANLKPAGDVYEVSGIELAFGDIKLGGGVKYNIKSGLEAAVFDTFAFSKGDNAQLAVTPIDGGFAVQVRGQQLDLKPMLKQVFGLGEGTGGVQSSQFNQTLSLNVKLDRAIGYFATTAFNLDLELGLRGTDLRRAKASAQFSEGNAISITTNPTPEGRIMTVAFNDAGTVLRLLGVYSQLAGGEGTLVLNTNTKQKVDAGLLQMRRFAIVDEANVAQILGNHSDSRAAIAQRNRLDFDVAKVDFLRRSDRVEVTNGMLTGSTVGGTMRGFIYTKQRQYDLTGTYVPLFGLNSVFQKLPVIGQLLGGREGEGLLGVTFSVTGTLDKPEFKINPLSALLPGALRELFEFRAKEQPRAE